MNSSRISELGNKARSDVSTGYNPTETKQDFGYMMLAASTMGIIDIGNEKVSLSGDDKKAYDVAYDDAFNKIATGN